MRDEKAIKVATKEAEEKIQRMLLDLCDRFGLRLEQVDVDTRNFANYRTEIIFADGK
jgi:hypothetical protein